MCQGNALYVDFNCIILDSSATQGSSTSMYSRRVQIHCCHPMPSWHAWSLSYIHDITGTVLTMVALLSFFCRVSEIENHLQCSDGTPAELISVHRYVLGVHGVGHKLHMDTHKLKPLSHTLQWFPDRVLSAGQRSLDLLMVVCLNGHTTNQKVCCLKDVSLCCMLET